PYAQRTQDQEGAVIIDEEPTRVAVVEPKERRGSDTGLYALIGGGAEGYTGALAPRMNVGPLGGVFVGVKDTHLGLEVGYTTSGLDVATGTSGGAGSGPDLVRNSGQAALTIGLSDTPFQPFLMGGVGLDDYRARNGQDLGFQNSQNFFAPVGVGARWNLTRFLTLDARGNYNFLFDEGFATDTGNSNRYGGQASIGGTF
ncbi:MAG: hypothetical protein L0Y64_25350, partial [Myxococcaceae bacterium]|nr:hypothetical protein [Myxococcaceae bacterium]